MPKIVLSQWEKREAIEKESGTKDPRLINILAWLQRTEAVNFLFFDLGGSFWTMKMGKIEPLGFSWKGEKLSEQKDECINGLYELLKEFTNYKTL